MPVRVPFTQRARKYGYLYWPSELDEEIKGLLGARKSLGVWLDKSYLGVKRIDWEYRRISLGWSRTRTQPSSAATFRINLNSDGTLKVVIE